MQYSHVLYYALKYDYACTLCVYVHMYRLFLSIDMSLLRTKTNIFRVCAKFGPLALLKIQYGRRNINIKAYPHISFCICARDIHLSF